MTPENFCYWLQGYFEIGTDKTLTKEQVSVIVDHLKLVFLKKTTEKQPQIATAVSEGTTTSPWTPTAMFDGTNFNDNWNNYQADQGFPITKIPSSC